MHMPAQPEIGTGVHGTTRELGAEYLYHCDVLAM